MFVITHLQGVVCMHNKGFNYNIQYYYHVSELSVCFSYFLSTHRIVIQNIYTDEDW